jgi:hypothetical protein
LRNFFESIKTLIVEVIGIIGGFLWARHTDWDYEPLLLFIISSTGLIISILLIIFKEKSIQLPVQPITSQPIISDKNTEVQNTNITEIDLNKIIDQVRSAPPFQQNTIASHFIGLSVCWKLKLFAVYKGENNKIRVTMSPVSGKYFRIKFETDIDKHPIFKIAEDQKPFEVSGKIINCNAYDIELDLATLKEI